MFDSLAWRHECYERYLGLDDEEEVDDEEAVAAATATLPRQTPSPPTLSRPTP